MKKLLPLFTLLISAFSFAQITIGTGTTVDSNAGLSTPISNWYSTSLSQFIYLASEINASGNITSVQFKLNGSSALPNSNGMIDVWIGHTTRSSYNPVVAANGADWIDVNTLTQVVTNGSFVQAGNTITFTFTTPFAYNGTDNLVITVDANKPGNDGSSMLFYQTAASPNIMCLMIRTDIAANNANPLNPPLNYTGGFAAESVQAKTTRPIIVIDGLDPLGVATVNTTAIALYPNPATSEIFIQSDVTVLSAEIYSLTGQLVKAGRIEGNRITIADLQLGMYLVKFNLENGAVLTGKFTKQ